MTQTREGVIVSAQVAPELRAELEQLAVEGDRSLSSEIRRALRQYLARGDDEQEEERRGQED